MCVIAPLGALLLVRPDVTAAGRVLRVTWSYGFVLHLIRW